MDFNTVFYFLFLFFHLQVKALIIKDNNEEDTPNWPESWVRTLKQEQLNRLFLSFGYFNTNFEDYALDNDKLKLIMTDEEIEFITEKFDKNKNEKIEFNEFLYLMEAQEFDKKMDDVDFISKVIKKIELNGVVFKEDLKEAIDKLGFIFSEKYNDLFDQNQGKIETKDALKLLTVREIQ
ncbi:uncharacterized protein LOC126900788 [Daktulosphaira vitifoliae]|uniref:uncharacterized protein LOC126900788 n=1 Tax=Daktulosphaira vitifoliae TaxID=58002 RepID=UPI0021AA4BDB|nr:uncharacterized protein LOC126900788 [Daktulosphaira vitifoliae]